MKKVSFKERLIQARINKGFSQTQLAKEASIAKTQLSRYETGKVIPKFQAVKKLADALGVRYSWLSGEEPLFDDKLRESTDLRSSETENLSESQYRFYLLVSNYPQIFKLWDWSIREINKERYENSLSYMSSGDATLARFFYSVWDGSNKEFDITAAATLDRKDRQLIASWLVNPFWP
ncbi:helix-turn-helix domain-containing protein [Dickeya sp. NCPPB 3274]|uniref:helix-turn-helix domain-containing protein n=1 Tax=Dickeya sp. NCPPB 3274 TaxID=568766 RepID=UPI0006ACB2E6|nr:helix-turn-helix transcriptional regulator [Dickeya sp. NCPPB 3274]